MGARYLTAQELEHLLESPDSSADLLPTSDQTLLHLLASLDREILDSLMTEERYAPGQIVCIEGEAGDATYVIWSGRAAIIKGDFDSPSILGIRGPGDIVGEMALLEDQPRFASVVALESLRLLRIDRENFARLLTGSSFIGMSIMAALSARLRTSDNIRTVEAQVERQLTRQVSTLATENQQLVELERVRQETTHLIVHDLRNPLSTISGVLSMFEVVLPPEVLEANRELLTIATTASRRMQRLIDSLLDLNRIESGEAELHLERVDLARLLNELAHRESLTLHNRNVTLEIDPEPDLPLVMIDAERIDRVLANLLDNALKFTPGGGCITITAGSDSGAVTISVIDTGPGIPEEDRGRIFESFTQSSALEAHGRRGFGLGLRFCRLAVEAHGGQIWVEPGPGDVGSRFVFTLPLTQ